MSAVNAILMNKNTPILEIMIEKSSIMKIGKVLNEDMLPIPLQQECTQSLVNNWFAKRLMPEKRDGLKAVRMLFKNIETEKYFFSLSDQYWVKYNQKDSWTKYNPFTNRYNSEVGKAFFEPWMVNTDHIAATSPDRTTNGVLKKRWVQADDMTSRLHKQGSIAWHQEPLSEVMASIMLKRLNLLPFVEYELIIDGLCFCSSCKNFVTQDTEFVPAYAIYQLEPKKEEESEYIHFIKMCEKCSIAGAREFMDKMIAADHIICNTDRHFGNFGFLRNADDGKILGFAPLFDCGSAYWGTTDKVEKQKSHYFKAEETAAVKKAWGSGLLKKAKSTKSIHDLLMSYPDITDKKKEAISTMIGEVDKELEMMAGSVDREKGAVPKHKKKEMGMDEIMLP